MMVHAKPLHYLIYLFMHYSKANITTELTLGPISLLFVAEYMKHTVNIVCSGINLLLFNLGLLDYSINL